MDMNVRIARELVKVAKELVAGNAKPMEKLYTFVNSDVTVYKGIVYKTINRVRGKHYWTRSEQKNMDNVSEDECIIVMSPSSNMDSHRKLIDSNDRFAAIQMPPKFYLQTKWKTDVLFDAMFVGMYTEEKLKKTVDLLKEILGEEPVKG